jgi:ATP-dependent exoDNAse (exonuclease V) alpha subunit
MATNPAFEKMRAAAAERTARMLADAAEKKLIPQSNPVVTKAVEEAFLGNTTITVNGTTFNPYEIEKDGKTIQLNKEQCMAVDKFGLQGQSGCLIGPAGTGKTTTTWAIIRAMIMSGRIPMIPKDATHKWLPVEVPGIFLGSFTRIATRNLRDNTPTEVKGNVHTIHKLLEFEPQFSEVWDEATGKMKGIRKFVPTRNAMRKLPSQLKAFFLDETSMVGTTLHRQLVEAAADDAQFIYVGDIAQLPPVMDDAVLGYKLLELPVVELTQVYRHAGAIVNLATHIRTGNTIPDNRSVLPYSANLRRMPRKLAEDAIAQWNKEEDGSKVTIHFWKTRLEGEVGQLRALQNLNNFFKKEFEEKRYDPDNHMILIPYNKSVGTIELNTYISQFLGDLRGAEVHEVISGFNKHYFAVGDKVFHDREEGIITKIIKNGMYTGKLPQQSAVTLDRRGHNKAGTVEASDEDHFASIEAFMAGVNVDGEDEEERKNSASHVITVVKKGDDKEYELRTASEINNLLFGYALTIHKSQGSQWPKVYCLFHNSHNRNLQREMLYTAITRAQKELYVICEPETFVQGVFSQCITGNTLKEKAEYFKGKVIANKKRDDLLKGEE